MSFIEDAARLAQADGNVVDRSSAEWAYRAFSVIAIAGELVSRVEGGAEIAEQLAVALAKAPAEVVIGGTMAIMQAHAGVKGQSSFIDDLFRDNK